MLSSISPLGERARDSRWWVTAAAYALGSMAGGLALGLVAGALGLLLPDGVRRSPWTWLVVGVALLLGAVIDGRSQGHGVPSWHRQVERDWIGRYRGWVLGSGFGVQLGFGLVTIITSTTTYAAVLLAALTGQVSQALVVGGVFGLVRALPLLGLARTTSWDDLRSVLARLGSWAPRAVVVGSLWLGTAGVLTLVIALRGVIGS